MPPKGVRSHCKCGSITHKYRNHPDCPDRQNVTRKIPIGCKACNKTNHQRPTSHKCPKNEVIYNIIILQIMFLKKMYKLFHSKN